MINPKHIKKGVTGYNKCVWINVVLLIIITTFKCDGIGYNDIVSMNGILLIKITLKRYLIG